uniref:Adenomatous polyposis coli protein n=1 Tax=Cura pinguis TaxID=69521 RepID=A0AA51NIH8_9PLAT|nr:adenomatous polyposis coli protein [Cura pinguis]
MSFNSYKKDFYTSPRHLSILRESPEDMFLNGERSEDVYVNFEDRSVINNSCSSFVKPLPPRPSKPPPPLPNSATTFIQPIHPPIPTRVSSNLVTMVTASTQTMNNAARVSCIEGNVPDILAFTLNNQTNLDNSMNLHSPSYQFSDGFAFVQKSSSDYDCMNNSELHYPQEDLTSNNVNFGSFITKYNNMMHDLVSWTIVNSNLDENSECDSQLDISRFELRRNAEKEFYQLLNDHIDVTMKEYYLSVFAAIQQIRNYCETLRVIAQYHNLTELNNYLDYEPGEATCNLMKMSFNENYRRIICSLGGLEALAQLIVINNSVLGDRANNYHLTVRRYACMALTNLTFGISENKALLCSIPPVLATLANFLSSFSEEVKQVAASVIRNLSWKADDDIKLRLREVNVSKVLTYESMKCGKESCLKSLLSALWNISAHSKENKIDICEVNGALAYFVDILNFKTIALVENSGGILRNVSSVIATSEIYRNILRQNNAFQILLKQLRSSSLTIVGNACGTLCNLSVDCQEDQQLLWDLGAVGMLKNLAHSKHRTISTGSAATLKNLLSARASLNIAEHTLINALKSNSTSSSNTPDSSPRILSPSPSLHVRKLNALESDIENILRNHQSVSISSDNKSTHDFYSMDSPLIYRQSLNNCITPNNPDSQMTTFNTNLSTIKRSGSDESMVSAHSDLTFDKANFQSINTKLKNASISLSKSGTQPGYLMSLSGYSNSSGHYDLTIEQCMKISNFSADVNGSNLSQERLGLDNNSNNNVLRKRNFHSYPDDYDSDNSEKPLDYSRQFGDTDEYMVYPTPIIPSHNDQNPVTTQNNVFRNIINIPPPTIKEKPKVYATEGTPVQCGSRMSPLSEEAIEDDVSNGFNPIPVLLEESCCYPVSKKPDLEKIEERATSEIRENYPSTFVSTDTSGLKLNKSVKFGSEPPHIIQDTPLMFSRSSSVGSLDSFETHSFHSSVQSEYSRRTSEVVSPSELPDSPGSETESKSPTKSINKTVLTKSRNSISPSYSSSLSMDDNNSSTGNGTNNAAILQECIQSGMPYSKQSEKLCKLMKNNDKYIDNCETAISYAIEGTPFNYSTKASSLSNISIPDPLDIKDPSDNSIKEQSSSSSDSEEQSELLSEIIQSAMPKGLNANTSLSIVHPPVNYIQTDGVSTSNTNCSTFITMSAMQYNSCYPAVVPHKSNKAQNENNSDVNLVKFPQFYYCDIDSPKQYGVEGTPSSLSQRDSICSETNLMIKVSSDIYSKPPGAPPKPPKRTTSTLSSVPEKSSIIHLREENVNANNEELHVYMTENTPADYSRASPVSHSLIVDTPLVCDYDKQVVKDIGVIQELKSNNDDRSSLSSLSIESAGMERTLLQQCISSAMPVPKLKQLTFCGRRTHSSENHTSKIKSQPQSDSIHNKGNNMNGDSYEMNSSSSNTKFLTDSNILINNGFDAQSKHRRIKSPTRSGIPTTCKSKLREPKKSFIPTPKQSVSANESVSSSKPGSEKSITSDTKSKSNCSLKSVLGYNSCLSSAKSNKKLLKLKSDQNNDSDKDYKTKSEQSINCSFLVNGFDVNQSGLAASKSDTENVSPTSNHDESQHSEISIDNNTYSIKDSIINDATKTNQADVLSETDTLELVEINELMDDDFLKDMSSSMEIDAAFCRNPILQDYGPGQFTDDDFTYDDFLETINEPPKSSNKSYEDLMKDGAQAVLASLNFMSNDENEQNSKGNTSSLTIIPQSGSSESLHLEINVSSSASSLNNYSQKKGPKIVKPSSDIKSSSPNPLGIRGGRKATTGIKIPTASKVSPKVSKPLTQVNIDKSSTYIKKTPQLNGPSMVSNKIKNQSLNTKVNNSTSKTNSNESINENFKNTTKITKPISIVNSNIMVNSLDQKPSNKNSKIPGLSSSVEFKINTQLKNEKQVKVQKKNVKIPRINENKDKIESFPINNNTIVSKLNECRNDDVSEGVWIIRNELCPDTVCIK